MTPGSSFSLVIDYECPGEDVDDAILDIMIRDKEGILFQGASADYGVDFGKLLRAGTFIIAFDCLPTNSAESPVSSLRCWANNTPRFTIGGDMFD